MSGTDDDRPADDDDDDDAWPALRRRQQLAKAKGGDAPDAPPPLTAADWAPTPLIDWRVGGFGLLIEARLGTYDEYYARLAGSASPPDDFVPLTPFTRLRAGAPHFLRGFEADAPARVRASAARAFGSLAVGRLAAAEKLSLIHI